MEIPAKFQGILKVSRPVYKAVMAELSPAPQSLSLQTIA